MQFRKLISKLVLLFYVAVFGTAVGMFSYSSSLADTIDKTVDGVLPSEGNSFFNPLIKVTYTVNYGANSTSNSQLLSVNQCKNVQSFSNFPVRVCARLAMPGAAKYPGDSGYNTADGPGTGSNAAYISYGNDTAITPDNDGHINPRVQLCAYEDPCDGMDPPNGKCYGNYQWYSPYQHNEVNKGAMSISQGAANGAIVAAGVGAPVGAMIGSFIAGVQQKYNHVVIQELGCVDVPLGPLPPQFCNSCWYGSPYAYPLVSSDPNSTFTSPKVDVSIAAKFNFPAQSLVISLDTTDSVDSNGNPVPYQGCTQSQDGRSLCGQISYENPEQICVSQQISSVSIPIACVPRDGYMPLPTVASAGDSNGSPTLTASLSGKSLTLQPDADVASPPECGYLDQIEFCAYRRCQTSVPPPLNSSTPANCPLEAASMCVSGYESNQTVVISQTTGAVIAGVPNTLGSNGIWTYTPTQCYQESLDSTYCSNRNGACCTSTTCPTQTPPFTDSSGNCIQYTEQITSAANDPYYIDTSTQMVRSLFPEELGLCVPIPPDMRAWIKSAGNYTYTVPDNCSQIQVEMWGGGSAGGNGNSNNSYKDLTGAGAGYLKFTVDNVNPGDNFTVSVGYGGAAKNRDGSPTILLYPQGSSLNSDLNAIFGGSFNHQSPSSTFFYANAGNGYGLNGPNGLERSFFTAPQGLVNPDYTMNSTGGTNFILTSKVPYTTISNLPGANAKSSHGKQSTGVAGGAPGSGTAQPGSLCAGSQKTQSSRQGVNNIYSGSGGCGADDAGYGNGGSGKISISCIAGTP